MVDVSYLPASIYFVKVHGKSGSAIQKLVVD
jgi:hypothetical protein